MITIQMNEATCESEINLKQGGVLSPSLFSVYIDDILHLNQRVNQ